MLHKKSLVPTNAERIWGEIFILARRTLVGDGPNTVSESTVSNTELSEFF